MEPNRAVSRESSKAGDVPTREEPAAAARKSVGWAEGIASRAKALKRRAAVLPIVLSDPRTPWLPRVVALLTLLYAISPVDLIPDFIPVLGMLDDIVIVPLGIWLTVRLLPEGLWEACEREAAERHASKPAKSWRGFALVACTWVVMAALGYKAVRWWLG